MKNLNLNSEFFLKWLILGTFAVWGAIALTGCNTVKGLAQDIHAVAEGIQDEMSSNPSNPSDASN